MNPSMYQEQNTAALLLENQKLGQENGQLKQMLSLFMENQDLKSRLQSFNNDTQDDVTVCFPSWRKSSSLWQTFNESQFTKNLQKKQLKDEHRTSSPVDFKSFIQSSMHINPIEESVSESCHTDSPPEVKDVDRFMGEIAYQLDRRILSHVFQGQKRLYGFTVLNIPEKIIEVSTHPLTGKVDEGYRLHLLQRRCVPAVVLSVPWSL
ncbi:hypothetical protein Q5P01_011137 [Channa striata]|uniref:Speriolin C-terminal domain-containing protein n=1 Tax=Channa striata TaxID=64152 RepID=A0AA88MVV0_CHASR|nr:hypothetical protein Q5P01_011137 [Channa striata]